MNYSTELSENVFVKGIGIIAATLSAAFLAYASASAAGFEASDVAFFEGAVGGVVLAGLLALLLDWGVKSDTEAWDVMNTEVPEVIRNNDFMTVVSNPENGSGVYVWDRESGHQIGVFDSEDIRKSIWLSTEDEVDTVVEMLRSDTAENRRVSNNE